MTETCPQWLVSADQFVVVIVTESVIISAGQRIFPRQIRLLAGVFWKTLAGFELKL